MPANIVLLCCHRIEKNAEANLPNIGSVSVLMIVGQSGILAATLLLARLDRPARTIFDTVEQ